MKHVIKENVELIINDDQLDKYQKLGFKPLSVNEATDEEEKKKPLSRMKLEELKTLAKELELDSDGLNGDELRKIIKDAQGK